MAEGMDLPEEIAELRRQLEEKSKADETEKSRLRLELEKANAEIKADEVYFDKLGTLNSTAFHVRNKGRKFVRLHHLCLAPPACDYFPQSQIHCMSFCS